MTKHIVKNLAAVGLFLLCTLEGAQAASYRCTVGKVTQNHPYLPSQLTLDTDPNFFDVAVRDVVIEGVSAPDTVGEVTYRNPKRLRLRWPSESYTLTGPRPKLPLGWLDDSPSAFWQELSLDRKTLVLTVRVAERTYGNSSGEAKGHCVLVR